MSSVDTNNPLLFSNLVKFENNDLIPATMEGNIGFSTDNDKFYGVTIGTDVEGDRKRSLTQTIASASLAGQAKIGANLEISGGILSSTAADNSRLYSLIVTVSTISGAADYTSINAAIEGAIGTPGGSYEDGLITQPIVLGSAPSETYPFYIRLAPGIYEQSSQIVLPDYVSIIGSGKDICKIKYTQSSNDTIENSSAIKLGTKSILKDFTLELDPNNKTNVSGVYNAKNNIIIDNVKIRDVTTSASTSTIYGFYGTGEYIQTFKDVDLLFKKGATTAYGLYFSGTINRLHNCNIDIDSSELSTANTANYGIYLLNCYLTESINTNKTIKYNDLYENNIMVEGANSNYGIYCNNSSINSLYNKIDCSRLKTGNSGNNYGVILSSSSSPLSSSSKVIKFNNVSGDNDTIESTDTDTVNFSSLGFLAGQYIKISGADNADNNNIFKIYSVVANLLTLESHETLVHEQTPSGTITISLVLDVKLYYNRISGSKHSIYSDSSNGNFHISEKYCILRGGDINLSNDKFEGPTITSIKVSKVNGDFNSLSNAVSSITSNNSSRRYLISIDPGEYIETNQINLTTNTTVIGSGINDTIIKFSNSGNNMLDSGGILLTNDTEIMNMTIQNIHNDNNGCYMLGTNGSFGNIIQNVVMKNIKLESSGTDPTSFRTGVSLNHTNFEMNDVNIDITGQFINYGIQLSWSEGNIYHSDISINSSNNATQNYGFIATGSNVNIHSSNIFVTSTNSSINYSIYLIHTTSDIRYVNLYNSSILPQHIGAGSGSNEYALYRDGTGNTGYHFTANNSKLNGTIVDTHTASTNICHFNNCYKIDTNNVYKPISYKGSIEETSNGSIIIGDNTGSNLHSGSGVYNTMLGTNTGNAITSGKLNTFIGSNVGNRITTSNENVLIGHNSGNTSGNNSVIIGGIVHPVTEYGDMDDNVLIGQKAGYSLGISNSRNIMIGNLVASNLTISSGQTDMDNVLIGNNCAASIDNGVDNVMIGDHILYDNASGNNPSGSVLFGNDVSYNSSNSGANTYLGYRVGYGNLGTENVYIGRESAYDVVDTNRNVCVGYKSLYQMSQGDQNVYIGNNAGYGMSYSTASFNIGIGNKTGYSLNNFGNRNIMFGGETGDGNNDAVGYSLTTGSNNIIFGHMSGKSITAGYNNILLGGNNGKSITTGYNNLFIGSNSGSTLTDKYDNIFIGSNSGAINNAYDNLFIGHNSGKLSTANRSISLGKDSGYYVSGDRNIFLGNLSGGNSTDNTTGTNNLLMGYKTGYSLTSGINNIIFGSGTASSGTGRNITTAANNVVFGYLGGSLITSGSENTLIGRESGKNITTANNNILIGPHTGQNLNTDDNIMIGYKSGLNQTTGIKNIYLGFESNKNSRTGDYNIGLGYHSGYNNNLKSLITDEQNNYNLCIGKETGYHITSNYNILIGKRAGYILDDVDNGYNIFVGENSGERVRTGDRNIYMGLNTGRYNRAGDKNIHIGNCSGIGATSYSANKNILIGKNSGRLNEGSKHIYIGNNLNESDTSLGVGYRSTTESDKNIYIGNDAGIYTEDSYNNIGIGEKSLYRATDGYLNIAVANHSLENLTTGNKNIGIGELSGKGITTGDFNICIGSLSGVCSSGSINKNILFGTSAGKVSAANNLISFGSESGYANTSGTNNIYIGTEAGKNNATSTNNIFFGLNAGKTVTGLGGTGNNVLIGSNAGSKAWISLSNTIGIGANALKSTLNATNIGIGSNASMNAGGNLNIAIGTDAHMSSTSGGYNIIMGKSAGSSGDGCSDCILIGYNSGKRITGSNNIALGAESQLYTTSSTRNISFGSNTLKNFNIIEFSGHNNNNDNLVIGTNAMRLARQTYNNIFIGTNAGEYYDNRNNSFGGNCLMVGTNAGRYQSSVDSIFIGTCAARGKEFGDRSFTSDKISMHIDGSNEYVYLSDTSGGHWKNIGSLASPKNQFPATGNWTYGGLAIRGFDNEVNNFGFTEGSRYAESNDTEIYNEQYLSFGPKASYEPNVVDEAEGNMVTIFEPSHFQGLAIGYEAACQCCYGGGESVGHRAGYYGSYGTDDDNRTGVTLYGPNAGKNGRNMYQTVAIGKNTLLGSRWGAYDVCVGNGSGAILTEDQEALTTTLLYNSASIGFGRNTLGNLQNKAYSTTPSAAVLYDNCVAIGDNCMSSPGPSSGTATVSGIGDTISLGSYAGYNNIGDYNVNIGYGAGYYSINTGGKNVHIGQYAGSNNPDGTGNIMLASNVNALHSNVSSTISNKLIIYQKNELESGDYPLMYGDLSNNILVINYRGTSVSSASTSDAKLLVNGDMKTKGLTPFTGVHKVNINYNNYDIEKGLIMSSSGEVKILRLTQTVVKVEVSTTQNDKAVYGIYAGYDRDNIMVASIGEGTILVINYGGDIENGDYISSSGIEGYGMKQADDILHSYTVAKATEDVIWNNVNEYVEINGNSYKKFLMSCTYHCG